MNVLNPSNSDHTLKVIPRFYPEGDITMWLFDEATRSEQSIGITPVLSNGYLYASFTKTFVENSNYQVHLLSGDDTVYRGKIFVTTQAADTQAYKVTKDIFIL